MTRLRMKIRHPGKEWDHRTQSWVRHGRVAKRRAIEDEALNQEDLGTCLDCGLPCATHPMPDRIWRSGPDLCAIAREADR